MEREEFLRECDRFGLVRNVKLIYRLRARIYFFVWQCY